MNWHKMPVKVQELHMKFHIRKAEANERNTSEECQFNRKVCLWLNWPREWPRNRKLKWSVKGPSECAIKETDVKRKTGNWAYLLDDLVIRTVKTQENEAMWVRLHSTFTWQPNIFYEIAVKLWYWIRLPDKRYSR